MVSANQPPNEHWSPDQPKNWSGVFGEPQKAASGSPKSEPGGETPSIAGGSMPLRPLRVTEVIGVSWQIVRKNLRACFAIAGSAAAVVGTVELIVLVTLQRAYPESVSLGAAATELLASGNPVTVDDLDNLISNSVPNVAAVLTSMALLQVAAFLVAGVLSQVVAASVLGKPITGGEAWRMTRSKSAKFIALFLLSTLILIAGFVTPLVIASLMVGMIGSTAIAALIIGIGSGLSIFLGILIFIRLLLTPVIASLESTGLVASLTRSNKLIKSSSLRVLWIYLLGSLLANAVGFLIAFPFLLLAGDATVLTSRAVFFNTAGSIVSYLVVLAFVSVLLAVIYTELRVRKEGLASALTKEKKSQPS